MANRSNIKRRVPIGSLFCVVTWTSRMDYSRICIGEILFKNIAQKRTICCWVAICDLCLSYLADNSFANTNLTLDQYHNKYLYGSRVILFLHFIEAKKFPMPSVLLTPVIQLTLCEITDSDFWDGFLIMSNISSRWAKRCRKILFSFWLLDQQDSFELFILVV